MIETVASRPWIPIIGIYGGRVSTSQSGRAWYQAPLDRASEGLFTCGQSIFPRRRRVVDGVSSDYTCGLRVRQSVQAIGRRGVPRQVRGFTCVSGTRDTTSDDSSARGLGKAAQLQVGRIGHDRQHPKRQQSDFVRLQTLCSRGAVLVRPSIVLEEEVVVAVQGHCGTQKDAEALLKEVVSTQSCRAYKEKLEAERQNSPTLERVQGEAVLFTLRNSAPCRDRLSSRDQRR